MQSTFQGQLSIVAISSAATTTAARSRRKRAVQVRIPVNLRHTDKSSLLGLVGAQGMACGPAAGPAAAGCSSGCMGAMARSRLSGTATLQAFRAPPAAEPSSVCWGQAVIDPQSKRCTMLLTWQGIAGKGLSSFRGCCCRWICCCCAAASESQPSTASLPMFAAALINSSCSVVAGGGAVSRLPATVGSKCASSAATLSPGVGLLFTNPPPLRNIAADRTSAACLASASLSRGGASLSACCGNGVRWHDIGLLPACSGSDCHCRGRQQQQLQRESSFWCRLTSVLDRLPTRQSGITHPHQASPATRVHVARRMLTTSGACDSVVRLLECREGDRQEEREDDPLAHGHPRNEEQHRRPACSGKWCCRKSQVFHAIKYGMELLSAKVCNAHLPLPASPSSNRANLRV